MSPIGRAFAYAAGFALAGFNGLAMIGAGLTLNNWAIGGAQTKDAKFGIIHGIGTQIDGFFNYATRAKGYGPSRTLFTFLISGNDDVRIVNVRAYFDDVLTTPERFGITNTKDSCLAIDSPSSTSYIKTQKRRADCVDPSRYVFWDTLHPTTRVHELMAQWAIEATPAAWGLR
jgi:phospholipase/lecithinase/hemolysin